MPVTHEVAGSSPVVPASSFKQLSKIHSRRVELPEKSAVIQPRTRQGRFVGFWSTGTGWGAFSQAAEPRATRVSLAVAHGELTCRSLTLTGKAGAKVASSAILGTASLPHQLRGSGTEVTFVFAKEVELKEKDQLTLTVSV